MVVMARLSMLSFSAVATERGITQPAISRQVTALEEQLGIRPVHRSTQAVTLTEEGRDLIPPAQQLLDAADGAIATCRTARPGSRHQPPDPRYPLSRKIKQSAASPAKRSPTSLYTYRTSTRFRRRGTM
jgi:DNA-binding HxlR family transcriptional regulator